MTHLRSISPSTTPEELAAIVAALSAIQHERDLAIAAAAAAAPAGDETSEWVRASRIVGRRASMTRGSWRLSGRVARRSRA